MRPGATTHSLRKTLAKLIDDEGLSARIGADRLGHSYVSTTQDRHVSGERIHNQVAHLLDRNGAHLRATTTDDHEYAFHRLLAVHVRHRCTGSHRPCCWRLDHSAGTQPDGSHAVALAGPVIGVWIGAPRRD